MALLSTLAYKSRDAGSSPARPANMINKGLFSSNSNEWATPTDFYKKLDAEFHFNLDPCATSSNAKCERFYTIEDDGLTQKWGWQERECFAILLTQRTANGSKNVTRRARTAKSWLCSFRQERTQPTSTTTSITRPKKSASSEADFISTIQSRERRSRQW